jgi:hypothetical protein
MHISESINDLNCPTAVISQTLKRIESMMGSNKATDYTNIKKETQFTYDLWMYALARGETYEADERNLKLEFGIKGITSEVFYYSAITLLYTKMLNVSLAKLNEEFYRTQLFFIKRNKNMYEDFLEYIYYKIETRRFTREEYKKLMNKFNYYIIN